MPARRALILSAVLTATLLVAAPSAAPAATALGDGNVTGVTWSDPGGALANSPNVYYLGTLATESPGIGGRYLVVNGQPRFYMTGAKGLSIYDVSVPWAPVLLGHLPLAHFQNEDVDVSDDGTRAIVSVDTASASPTSANAGSGVYVVDIEEVVPNRVLRPAVSAFVSSSNHTSTCADPACEWIYGSSRRLIHVEGRGATASASVVGQAPTGGHAFNRDAAGIMISDSTPRLVLDPREDPSNPRIVTQGKASTPTGYLEHNNVRTGALEWVPRDPENPADAYEAGSFEGTSALRPGELLVGNTESNLNPTCANAGGLSTWDMRDWDKGRPLQQIDILQPANGLLATDGRPPVNGLGCSGHWFTVKDNMIAASWYEHGTRFVSVDPANGEMTEVGWFQPVATEAGAAHWIGQVEVPGLGRTLDIVYNVDYARGIDIIAFDREGPLPSDQQLVDSWLANLDRSGSGVFANAERLICSLAARTER